MTQATNIEQQIQILQSRNLIIHDEKKACEILADKGYFRLCTYFFPFRESYPRKQRNKNYKQGTRFEDGVDLYYFDVDLRRLMQKYLARIEVSVRTTIIYEISNYYSTNPTWFADSTIVNATNIQYFQHKIYTTNFINDHIAIRRHNHQHPGTYAPAWKTLEYMTFGSVLKLFGSIYSVDARRLVTQRFGIATPSIFEEYLTHICTARNICAHGSALFDVRLNTAIPDGPAGQLSASGNKQNLQGLFTIIYYILQHISENRAEEFKKDIYQIFRELEHKNPKIYPQIVHITGYNEDFFNKKCKIFAYFKKKLYLCSEIQK